MFCVSTIFDHGVIGGATMKEILYYSSFFKIYRIFCGWDNSPAKSF